MSPPWPLIFSLLMMIQNSHGAKPLLVLLIDGFRWDYLQDLHHDHLQDHPHDLQDHLQDHHHDHQDHDHLQDHHQDLEPGFGELQRKGVTVEYLVPDFPSLSYPNYYSLMTGRHCDVHHMTGNYMWDQTTAREFVIGSNDDSLLPLWWNGSEPLWVSLQRLGKDVYMYYWPGCEVEILGVRPKFCEPYVYDPSVSALWDSILKALHVLRSGDAVMATVYYETIDVEGHHHGPDSPQVRQALKDLDAVIQRLNKEVRETKMEDDLNIIMFSDHGMTNISVTERVIELEKYVNMSDIIKIMDRGPVVSVWPADHRFKQVYAALSAVSNMKVYTKENIPERFHYKGGKFVSPLTLVCDPGWFITENKAKLPRWNNTSSGEASAWYNGWHGYDNDFEDMRGFFLAKGPDFKQNVRAAPIRAVDVYNLMCWTLGVEPLPNNGSWSRVEALLKASACSKHSVTVLTYFMCLISCTMLLI